MVLTAGDRRVRPVAGTYRTADRKVLVIEDGRGRAVAGRAARCRPPSRVSRADRLLFSYINAVALKDHLLVPEFSAVPLAGGGFHCIVLGLHPT